MKKLLRSLLALLLTAGLVAAGYWFYTTRLNPQQAAATDGLTQVVAVQQGDLSATISVVGELAAMQQATLAFDRMAGSAPLVTLDVETGSRVVAGQVLATIDPTPYQQALDQARSALQQSETRLANLKEPPTELQIAQADLAVAQARLDLQNAQDALAALQSADSSALQQAVQDAEDNLALARLQLTLTEHGSQAKSERDLIYAVQWRQRKIWDLRDLSARGQANLEQTQQLAAEEEALLAAQADLAQVQAQRQLALQTEAVSVATAQSKLAEAQQALAAARAGGDALDLARAQVAVQQAGVSLAAAEDARAKLDVGADEVELAAAQADLDKKRLAVEDASLDLAGATLTAPFNSTVLSVNARAGSAITARTQILTLADLTTLQVLASVDETTIRQVAVGQAATLAFDALPGRTFRGAVQAVPLQGSLQGGVMVYEVPVSLEGAEGLPLLVGMTANVTIAVGQVQNALLVPAMALQNLSGMYQVLVPNTDPAGAPVAVPVEIGLSDGTYTQIVRGLVPGDQVVVQLTTAQSNQFGFGGMSGLGGMGGGFVAPAPGNSGTTRGTGR